MRYSSKAKQYILKAAAFLLAIVVWQAAAMALDSKILLASPVNAMSRLFAIFGEADFSRILWFSFRRIASGFFLAFLLGVLLAVISGRFRAFELLLWPYMVTIKSVPVASFIVIALMWLSSRRISVFISFLMVLPIVYTNVLEGIRHLDPKLTEMASVFRVPWRRRFLYIWLPQLKPYIFSACRLSLGLAWKAGIAAEIIGIPDGSIGEMLYQAKVYYNTADLFAWTIVIVAVSVIFEKAVLFIIRRIYRGIEKL